MSIPDAPWIGLCRDDYYGYDEEDEEAFDEEEEEDEELYG